jgi:hypothetical protein
MATVRARAPGFPDPDLETTMSPQERRNEPIATGLTVVAINFRRGMTEPYLGRFAKPADGLA